MYYSVTGKVVAVGRLYGGDLQAGDRPATQQEIDAGLASESPAFSVLKEVELSAFRADRERFLNRLTGIAARAERAGRNDIAGSCDSVAVGLLDLTSHPTVAAATTLVGLRNAMKTVYTGIVGPAPAEVKAAFKEVDK